MFGTQIRFRGVGPAAGAPEATVHGTEWFQEDDMTAVISYPNFGSVRPVSLRPVSVRPMSPRLRLTRRGRVVFATLAAIPLVIAGLVFGLGASDAVATQDATGDSLTWVTVDGGQSLWDLAAEIAPTEDPREFAAQVVSFNHLASSEVQAGQELALPTQYTD
jgi:hypothetical protein